MSESEKREKEGEELAEGRENISKYRYRSRSLAEVKLIFTSAHAFIIDKVLIELSEIKARGLEKGNAFRV